MFKIFYVRHGESEKYFPIEIEPCSIETANKYPLTTKGKNDAQQEAKKYDNFFDIIITSPFLRAKETAEIFLEHSPSAILTENILLKDLNVGDFDDQPLLDSDNYRISILKNNPNIKFGGGESLYDVQERLLILCKELKSKYENKNILLVSHSGPLMVLKDTAEKKDLSYWEDFIPNTTVFELNNIGEM